MREYKLLCKLRQVMVSEYFNCLHELHVTTAAAAAASDKRAKSSGQAISHTLSLPQIGNLWPTRKLR